MISLTGLPTVQPTGQLPDRSSGRPSVFTTMPFKFASDQPTSAMSSHQSSGQPTAHSIGPPPLRPANQRTVQPSPLPEDYSLSNRSSWPTSQSISLPSSQPTGQPSSRPTASPSAPLFPVFHTRELPTCQPTNQFSTSGTTQPTVQKDYQPMVNPTCSPQPFTQVHKAFTYPSR